MVYLTKLKEMKMTFLRTLKSALIGMCAVFLIGQVHAQNSTKMTITAGVDPSFAAFFVGKEAGIFAKHGLDVTVRTGPSGSSLVPLLINGETQAAIGAEGAGISNYNASNGKVVFVGETAYLRRFYSLLGRPEISSLEDLKGKRVGVSTGTGGELFWTALLDNRGHVADGFLRVQVDAPEMIAAFERGDIDAFAVWEPWVTRSQTSLGSKVRVIQDGDGIFGTRAMTYMNRDWIEKNPDAAKRFMRALVETMDYIRTNQGETISIVSNSLKMDAKLVKELISKLDWRMNIDQDTINSFAIAERQLSQSKRLTKPLDWAGFIYPELLREVLPTAINYKAPN
jgi:NitT/TauT family transport system substrate-binding protein